VFVAYYKLMEQPFGVTPNPRYLYLTPTHREAMASIFYGVMENRGFGALIAPPGMGKTTLLFDLLQRCGESMRTIFLFQFQPSPEGLLRNLLAELEIPDDGESFVGMQEKLNQAILRESKQGKRIVIVVDEAQNSCEPVLEALRMLSNFETSQEKLMHIILSGQPQLADKLFSPAIEQLRQRISIMAVLRPLNAQETREYIQHRLRVAGYQSAQPLFTTAACELIAEYSGGIPRNINNYCFNAMSLGCALKKSSIGREIVSEVFHDLNLADTSANPAKASRPSSHTPEVGFMPVHSPAMPSSGRGLRLSAGVISFAAVLCVAGVLANQHLNSSSRSSVASPTSPARESITQATAPASMPDTLTKPVATKPEAEPIPDSQPDSKPELQSVQGQGAQAAAQGHAPIAKQERVKLVKASQHETLYQLCARSVVTCDAGALREIQHLNPWLHNASQLQAGQPIRVPLEAPRTESREFSLSKTNPGEKR
jgi:type II secretory pathway predicted ATPase ExeA